MIRLGLSRFFVNLLTNAAKYNHAGGKIRVIVEHDSDNATIRVENTGMVSHPKCCRAFGICSHRTNRNWSEAKAVSASGLDPNPEK
jgi:signal transduction histidine kinase